MSISFRVNGAGKVLEHLRKVQPDVKLRVQSALEFIGAELVSSMKSKAATFQRRSGKLERSFYHAVYIRQGGDLFVLRAGVNRRAFYGAFQDVGVTRKTRDVKGYTRRVKSLNVREGRRKVASGVGFVGPYRREIYLNPKPFIQISLEQMRGRIIRELQLAVQGGLG